MQEAKPVLPDFGGVSFTSLESQNAEETNFSFLARCKGMAACWQEQVYFAEFVAEEYRGSFTCVMTKSWRGELLIGTSSLANAAPEDQPVDKY